MQDDWIMDRLKSSHPTQTWRTLGPWAYVKRLKMLTTFHSTAQHSTAQRLLPDADYSRCIPKGTSKQG